MKRRARPVKHIRTKESIGPGSREATRAAGTTYPDKERAAREPRTALSRIGSVADQYSGIGGAADPPFFSGISVISASVVSRSAAIDAAF